VAEHAEAETSAGLTRRQFGCALGAGLSLASAQNTPMQESELTTLTAVELAARLRRKDVSARDVLAAHLAQIERVNPKVNAIVTLAAERAMADAARADERIAREGPAGVLHGLPVAHKDLVETAGIRTTRGSPFYRDFVPAQDALLVSRIRSAGAITLGKTNTPELGAGSQTFNTIFGATRNPYDVAKTCGGSSGGAAVALACNMVPIADGSDTGGSLRNPAAFCNVVGLRPSPGRVPRDAASWSPLSVGGPMARTVQDLALFLSAMAGPDVRDPLSIAEEPARFRAALDRSFKGVRVAWWRGLGGIPFEPEIRQTIDAHRRTFEELGCVVEDAEPDFAGVDQAFTTLRYVNNHTRYSAMVREHPEWVKDTIKFEVAEAERLSAVEVARAITRQNKMYEDARQFFTRYEYFVLPVTQVSPFDVDTPYPTRVNDVPMTNYVDWMRSCWYITLTAGPAISVPAGFTTKGLPIGIQIVGRHRAEWSVLQIAHAFEQATGVGRRRPQV
jgi:amidase